MDLTPKPDDPKLTDPEQMRNRATRPSGCKPTAFPGREGKPWTTQDGVPVDTINVFYQHKDGEVTTHDNSTLGFVIWGDLYADRKKALEAALSFWEARRTDATVKIRAICKELGLTG